VSGVQHPGSRPDAGVPQRMGLFVVAKLALRHGIHVRLGGAGELDDGTSALVVIPRSLMQVSAPDRVTTDQMTGQASSAPSSGRVDLVDSSSEPVDQFDAGSVARTPPTEDTHTYHAWPHSSTTPESDDPGAPAAPDTAPPTERFLSIGSAVSQWFAGPEHQPGHGGITTATEREAVESPSRTPVGAAALPIRQPPIGLTAGAMTPTPSDDQDPGRRPTSPAGAGSDGQHGVLRVRRSPHAAAVVSHHDPDPTLRSVAHQEQA
jgi:hypothetical protein